MANPTAEKFSATEEFLYSLLPAYQRLGGRPPKFDLRVTEALLAALGNPERAFKSIHVGGTNGKGSVTHSVAYGLQKTGLGPVGLYTSPHLLHFSERIRVDGDLIPEAWVIDFVAAHLGLIDAHKPSFFEFTFAMACAYFRECGVQWGVIEVGMGGRLDSTNVITPELAVITNVGYDHQDMLGETLAEIAGEKAGIIKPGVPVVVGDRHPETTAVFIAKAERNQAPLTWVNHPLGALPFQINRRIAEVALQQLSIPVPADLHPAGIRGRWELLAENPWTVADVAHNAQGLNALWRRIAQERPGSPLHIVLGGVKEKRWDQALAECPTAAAYYFCTPHLPRALAAEELQKLAQQHGLQGRVYPSVQEALENAQAAAQSSGSTVVTGSFFVVSEVLPKTPFRVHSSIA